PLPRQRGASAREWVDDLLVGLLPRRDRASVSWSAALEGRVDCSQPLYGQGDHQDVLLALPVRPRPRTRADDLQPQRPALLAQGVRPPRDVVGPDLVHGGRLHAELPARSDAPRTDEVAEKEVPALPVRQRRGAGQALLLPDGDLAGVAGRPLRLP